MKVFLSCFILYSLPILLSMDILVSEKKHQHSFVSPEGIVFSTDSKQWDESKLRDLYKELLLNKFGKEIYNLNEVRVAEGYFRSKTNVLGTYHPLTNVITLYQAESFSEPEQYRYILSHEYGHHFANHYFPSISFRFSEWQKIRGLEEYPVDWRFMYRDKEHKWSPHEIFAEDYVVLFGPSFPYEPFEKLVYHENLYVPSPIGNTELHNYIKKVTGLSVDDNLVIDEPILVEDDSMNITFLTNKDKKDVIYILKMLFIEREDGEIINTFNDGEIFYSKGFGDFFTTDNDGKIEFNVKSVFEKELNINGEVLYQIKVYNQNTNKPFHSKVGCISYDSNKYSFCDINKELENELFFNGFAPYYK